VLEVKIISEIEQFADMREEWNTLLSESYTNTIFLTWEWLYSWWKCFGEDADLFIVVVRDKTGKLIGVAPLFIKNAKFYSFPVRQLGLIGEGHSDRQDFIITKDTNEAIYAIEKHILMNRGRWDIIKLDQIPETGALCTVGLKSQAMMEKERSSICPFVRIEGEWEGYFRGLGKKFRKDIRHKMNRLKRFGEWKFIVQDKIEKAEEIVDVMREIEASSRKEDTEKEFVGKQENSRFLKTFFKISSESEWVDFSVITVGDEVAAYLLGFVYNRKYCAYSTSYRNKFYQGSPGKLLLNEKLKWCFSKHGELEEFDFLRGSSYVKSLWSDVERQHMRMMLFKKSAYGKLLRSVGFKVRPMAKNLLEKARKLR
jgi:CelD/BcsL family acetyltransferase involved in cellulose biosynthesis